MFTNILLASDGSECALKAATVAATLASKFTARLTIINIYEPIPTVGPYGEIVNVELNKRYITELQEHAISPLGCIMERMGMPYKGGRVEPIFDFLAQTVGWLEGEVAFSEDGCPVAFIHGGAVFAAKNGHHLGTSTTACSATVWAASWPSSEGVRSTPPSRRRRKYGRRPASSPARYRAAPICPPLRRTAVNPCSKLPAWIGSAS